MKKILLLFALMLIVFSCKNSEEKKAEETTSETTSETTEVIPGSKKGGRIYQGEFIYMDDIAVFKGDVFIYGVAMNEVSTKLAEQVKAVKKDEFDMVPVIVRGIVSPKPENQEGWEEIITLTAILEVGDEPAKADIKFEEKKS